MGKESGAVTVVCMTQNQRLSQHQVRDICAHWAGLENRLEAGFGKLKVEADASSSSPFHTSVGLGRTQCGDSRVRDQG